MKTEIIKAFDYSEYTELPREVYLEGQLEQLKGHIEYLEWIIKDLGYTGDPMMYKQPQWERVTSRHRTSGRGGASAGEGVEK